MFGGWSNKFIENNNQIKINKFFILKMIQSSEDKIEQIKSHITSYPDFPKKGILFRDIFSALANGEVCKTLKEVIIDHIRTNIPQVQCVAGLEARGFLFCLMVAAELGIPCIPIRKKGKLPGKIKSFAYTLEYGTDVFEIQSDNIKRGQKVLLIDDLLATGGSLNAATQLLTEAGAEVVECLVVIELVDLQGRDKISAPVHSLIQYND